MIQGIWNFKMYFLGIAFLLFSNCIFAEPSQRFCENTFTKIYRNNSWKGTSRSGTGSDLEQTIVLRRHLPTLLRKYKCLSMIDAPCGDFYWMKDLDLPIENYIGIDVVRELIEINQQSFGNKKYSFISLDMTQEILPKADLIFCRDCLVHFSYCDIAKTIRLLKKSGAKYLLTTSFINRCRNTNIRTGRWRPLNLLIEPFNFPEPLEIVYENCTERRGKFKDKCLLLWDIQTLPDLDFDYIIYDGIF